MFLSSYPRTVHRQPMAADTPRAGTAPPIRETVFARDAGLGRGDDHVTRAIDAIERGPGIDGDGHHERRIERAGWESGRLEREIHRGPGSGRFRPRARAREGRRAEAARRRPRGAIPPSRFRPTPTTPRDLPQPTLRARPAEPGALATLDSAAAGETMIGQAQRWRVCAGEGAGERDRGCCGWTATRPRRSRPRRPSAPGACP